MIGWVGDIEHTTKYNPNFRTVLFTGRHVQLTVMRVLPGEEIGREVHPNHDQFLRIEKGHARIELGPSEEEVEETYDVQDGWAAVVPAGVWHNVVNTGLLDLELYSLYAPPVHLPGTVHRTKTEAEHAEANERAVMTIPPPPGRD